MAGPFYNAIKGTTSGTPGTGAFTPNAASTGHLAWSTVPTGWIGLVRFEDGSAWSLEYCYWNGTTLSRASTQVSLNTSGLMTSSGSHLSLTSAATAAMVADARDMQPHLASISNRWAVPLVGGSGTFTVVGFPAMTIVGTGASAGIVNTFIGNQVRAQSNSATTANAQAGFAPSAVSAMVVPSTTAGIGGWEISFRFGAAAIPASPRLMCGVRDQTFSGITTEPGATSARAAFFGKDSTDTNIQCMTDNASGTANKIDTGIPLVANAWYEGTIWQNPGSLTTFFMLIRLDTGAIFNGSTTTKTPPSGVTLIPQFLGGLSSASTLFSFCLGNVSVRTGA